MTFKTIFHKALNLFRFDCEITLESVPGTNQYLAIWIKFLAYGNNRGLWLGSNPRPPHNESDVQPTAPRRPSKHSRESNTLASECWRTSEHKLISPTFVGHFYFHFESGNQNMFKQLENWVYFAFWLWKSLSYNVIDNYITIETLLHFCQYTISFFKSKSMSKLTRSDISSNECKFMFAILLQLLLLFLYECVFAYVIRIVDLSFICK